MTSEQRPPLKVACPTCGGPSLFAPSNAWRPFCSERCRNIDFGAWADEQYRVEQPPGPEGLGTDGGGDWPDNEDPGPRH